MDIFAVVPQFGGLIYTVLAFVAALSVIVAVHEYGHYIVGRWSGIHAEVFSLGFGPVLYSRVDRRGTRWQIAALPFGGFVRFLGDANAASGKDAGAMSQAAQDPVQLRRTMHGAPLWARAATVAAGPMFNFIMSILVFTAIFMVRGINSDPLTVGKILPLPGVVQELQVGDEILAINGVAPPPFDDKEAWDSFRAGLPELAQLDYTVRRGESEVSVDGPFLYPALVGAVLPRSAGMDAGLEVGDVITGIDNAPIFAFDQLKSRVEGSDGRALKLDVWRAGRMLEFVLVPRSVDEQQDDSSFEKRWRIGIGSSMAFEPARESVGPWQALKGGVVQTGDAIVGSISGLWHIVTGTISTCNISGPIGIAQVSGDTASQGVQSFVAFIALLSTAVGMLNLFPVPALDGGHLVFYAYEAVAGRPPSDFALRILMSAGIALILSLMLFALFNDVFC